MLAESPASVGDGAEKLVAEDDGKRQVFRIVCEEGKVQIEAEEGVDDKHLLLNDNKSKEASEVEGASPGDFCFRLNPKRGLEWISMLKKTYGIEVLLSITVLLHVIKGMANAWISTAVNFYFKGYGGINSSQIQVYTAVAYTPWTLKGIMGYSSDCVLIGGLNKAPYIAFFAVLSVASCAVLGFTPMGDLPIVGVVGCLFFINFQIAMGDLLTEAKYSEKVRERPEKGADLISFVWGGISCYQLISIATVGVIIEHLGARWIYALAVLPLSLAFLPVAFNWLQETRKEGVGFVHFDTSQLQEQKNYFRLTVWVTVLSLSLAALGIASKDAAFNFGFSIFIGSLVVGLFFFYVKPIIAKVTAFFMISSLLTISIEGASFYFFTDDEKQYPEGPHFSAFFYTTAIGLVACVCRLLGITLFNMVFREWKYRSIFFLSTMLWLCVNTLSIIVYKRLNVEWGISDSFFVLGSQVFQQVIMEWNWIPGVLIMSHLCPKGLEATVFALVAGALNLGSNISNYSGAFMLQVLEVQPSGDENETAQFDNLWVCSMISAVAPCFALLLLPVLIPDATPQDKLDVDNDGVLTVSNANGQVSEEDALGASTFGEDHKHAHSS